MMLMPVTKLKAQLKSLAKRSRLIVESYHLYRYLNITSGKDIVYIFKNLSRLKLIWKVNPYTMLSYRRLSTLHELACRFVRTKQSGSFIECGVRNGGSAAVMAAAARNSNNRHVWLFDSWEGLPEPDKRDFTGNPEQVKKGKYLGSEDKVKEILFGGLKLDSARIHLIKGWFSDNLPRTEIGKIALLHLDCDLYESVKFCLDTLYDDVIEGGCIVIDDYGYWSGCKEAVDEFIKYRKLKVDLIRVDSQGVYFFKKFFDNGKTVKSAA